MAITEPVPLYLVQDAGLVNATPEEFSEAAEEGTDPPADLAGTKDYRRHLARLLTRRALTTAAGRRSP